MDDLDNWRQLELQWRTKNESLYAELSVVRDERDVLKAECDDLRDAIRLMIGIKTSTPFGLVPQSDVDGWLERIRQLKKGG